MGHKAKLISFVVIIALVVVIGVGTLISFGVYKILEYHTRFITCDSTSIINHIQNYYGAIFPKDCADFQAAEKGQGFADQGFDYILKFTASPESVQHLLNSLPKGVNQTLALESLDPYRVYKDYRLEDPNNRPQWFMMPMSHGYICHINTKSSSDLMEIYIDTKNKDRFTVYISGVNMFRGPEVAHR